MAKKQQESSSSASIVPDTPSPLGSTDEVLSSHDKIPWWNSSSFKIYVCHIFSSWGDRMWGFAVGLYMVILFPDSLLLTATYGFANALSCIIFAPYIGGWIDKTQRITAARRSVIVQNTAVVLGACILTITLSYRSSIKGMWDGHLENILYAIIIMIAIVAELASIANKIALEKDWIVVLSGGDNKKLARLNSTMRTINLTTFILAPIVVGQIIHFASPEAGAVFIAIWNIISGVIEYSLLLQIYKIVPQLSTKICGSEEIPFDKISSSSTETPSPPRNVVSINNNSVVVHGADETLDVVPRNGRSPGPVFDDVSHLTPVNLSPTGDDSVAVNRLGHQHADHEDKDTFGSRKSKACMACDGWKSYISHHIRFAGLGLGCLYMTVLGFDSITIGFLYSQGVHESFIGFLTAIGAVFGILGSLSFPILRRKLGENKTGISGFLLETLCLLFCVGSVFVKGSPFKPEALVDRFDQISGTPSPSHPTYSIKDIWEKELHVIVLLFGLVIARFGLWIADLSVTQIFQEEVEESQRGIINGVQDSLNQFMNLIKFVLVILLPSEETFGLLIFTSWFFCFLGFVCFVIFARVENKRKKRPVPGERPSSITRNDPIIVTISDKV